MHSRDFSGLTEMRPGVYVFNDLDQEFIGSCAPAEANRNPVLPGQLANPLVPPGRTRSAAQCRHAPDVERLGDVTERMSLRRKLADDFYGPLAVSLTGVL